MDKLVFYNDNQNVLISQPEITTISLGTVAPASSDDTRLRVFNPSDTYQADDVILTSLAPETLLLSLDGDTYSPTLNLGDLPPSGLSDPITMRRVTPSTAQAGPFTGRLRVLPTAWTAPIDISDSDNVPLPTDPDDDTGTGPVDDRPTDPDLDLDDPNA